jgi:hypothetical protein
MAFATFLGTGIITGEFTVNDIVVTSMMLPGEYRLQKAFPYPTLENWRGAALTACASIDAWDTRGRVAMLFAHESDMGSMFFELTGVPPELLAGDYNFRRKASLADKDLAIALKFKELALQELAAQKIPDSHIALIRSRLESATFNHRVTGICAAVFITALLLEEAEAIT